MFCDEGVDDEMKPEIFACDVAAVPDCANGIELIISLS